MFGDSRRNITSFCSWISIWRLRIAHPVFNFTSRYLRLQGPSPYPMAFLQIRYKYSYYRSWNWSCYYWRHRNWSGTGCGALTLLLGWRVDNEEVPQHTVIKYCLDSSANSQSTFFFTTVLSFESSSALKFLCSLSLCGLLLLSQIGSVQLLLVLLAI